MAVTDTDSHQHIPRFFGLSTDTKPVGVPVASTFTATDTQEEFVYDGADWVRDKTVVVEQVGTITVNEVRATSVLLDEILMQLKIQNAHLAIVTGEELDDTDISEA
jgi:hypothetical protein